MEQKEILELIKLYIGTYSNGYAMGVDMLVDILSDIESGCSFDEIVEHYDLA